jgi:hypothetical protein
VLRLIGTAAPCRAILPTPVERWGNTARWHGANCTTGVPTQLKWGGCTAAWPTTLTDQQCSSAVKWESHTRPTQTTYTPHIQEKVPRAPRSPTCCHPPRETTPLPRRLRTTGLVGRCHLPRRSPKACRMSCREQHPVVHDTKQRTTHTATQQHSGTFFAHHGTTT